MSEILRLTMASDLSEFDSSTGPGMAWSGNLRAKMGGLFASVAGGLATTIDGGASTTGRHQRKNFTQFTTTVGYEVSGYIHLNSITMPNGNGYSILSMFDDGSSRMTLQVEFSDDQYQYRMQFRDDTGSTVNGGYEPVSDALHFIRIRVQYASNTSSSDGQADIWIDGFLLDTMTGLDIFDDSAKPDNLRIGAVDGIDSGTVGTTYHAMIVVRDDITEIVAETADLSVGRVAFSNHHLNGTTTSNRFVTSGTVGANAPKATIIIEGGINQFTGTDVQARMSIGGATGSAARWSMGSGSADAQGNTNTGGSTGTDRIPYTIDNNGTSSGKNDLANLIDGGVEIDLVNNIGNKRKFITASFFGDNVIAQSGVIDLSTAAVDVELQTTLTGFGGKTPDLIILGTGHKQIPFADSAGFGQGLGFCLKDLTQMGWGMREPDAQAAGSPGSVYYDNRILPILSADGGTVSLDTDLEVTTLSSTVLGITQKTNGNSVRDVGYIALYLGLTPSLFIHTTPTSPGTVGITDPGNLSRSAMIIATKLTASGTIENNAKGGSISFNFISDWISHSIGITIEDGAGTTDTSTYIRKGSGVNLLGDSGGTEVIAPVVNFTSPGYELDYTTVGGTARKQIHLVFPTNGDAVRKRSTLVSSF